VQAWRADADDLSTGILVQWDASGGTAYGEIEEVATSGSVSAEPEGPTMEGTEDEPAYLIRVWQEVEDGWEPSDVRVVHRAETLTVIDDLPERGMDEMGDGRGRHHRSYTCTASIRASSDKERVTVRVMTEDIARDGMVLRADGIETNDFERNPVVLWQHGMDPMRGSEPIGRAVDLVRVDGGLQATVEFTDDPDDAFAQRIARKVMNGEINAVSLGWRTLDMEREEVEGRKVPVVTRADMTEFSFVGVGADPSALVQRSDDDLVTLIRGVMRSELNRLQQPEASAAPKAPASATADPPASDPSTSATAGETRQGRDDEPTYIRKADLLQLVHEQRAKREEKAALIAKQKLGKA